MFFQSFKSVPSSLGSGREARLCAVDGYFARVRAVYGPYSDRIQRAGGRIKKSEYGPYSEGGWEDREGNGVDIEGQGF